LRHIEGRRDTERAVQDQTNATHTIVFGKFHFARIAATAANTDAAHIPIAIFSFVAASKFTMTSSDRYPGTRVRRG
jgi:hypothetical protein